MTVTVKLQVVELPLASMALKVFRVVPTGKIAPLGKPPVWFVVVFGAYNAITGYFQNVRSYKNDEAKLKSLLFGGTGQLRTQKAFNLCEDFALKGDNAFRLN